MRIRLKANIAGPDLPCHGHYEGDVVTVGVEIPEATANEMLLKGLAEEVVEGTGPGKPAWPQVKASKF